MNSTLTSMDSETMKLLTRTAIVRAAKKHKAIFQEQGFQKVLDEASQSEIEKALKFVENGGQPPNDHNLATALAFVRGERDVADLRHVRQQGLKLTIAANRRRADEEEHLEAAMDMSIVEQPDEVLEMSVADQQPEASDHSESEYQITAADIEAQREWDIDHCMMSGAVHADDNIKPRERRLSNGPLVCEDSLETMAEHMPWKILGHRDFENYLPLRDPQSLRHIPSGFRSTARGVKEAIDDQEAYGEGANDGTLLASLGDRGGMIPGNLRVEYAENIRPCKKSSLSRRAEYWNDVWAQADMGFVWDFVLGDLSQQQFEDSEPESPLVEDENAGDALHNQSDGISESEPAEEEDVNVQSYLEAIQKQDNDMGGAPAETDDESVLFQVSDDEDIE